MSFSVVILTGGASSRMGEDKARLDWGGRSAVARLADLARELGAATVITAGAEAHGLPFVVENPPGGGPVAGIVAAASLDDRLLVLAVDAPTIRPNDLAALLTAAAPGAAYEGLHLPMVLETAAIPAEAGAGWPVGRLIERAGLLRLPTPPGAAQRLRGANTPAERAALLAAETAEEPGAA